MVWSVFLQGMMMSGGLIIAIGAQNAFVIRQGLIREQIFPVVMVCIISDWLLIGLGIFGAGRIFASMAWLSTMMTLFGVVFLFWYGWRSFKNAYRAKQDLDPKSLEGPDRNDALSQAAESATTAAATKATSTVSKAIAAALGITLLNPHVYLDTVVLIGSITQQFNWDAKTAFWLGAGLVSSLWFLAIGYGAYALSPILNRPKTWVVLDVLIGLMMWGLATHLMSGLF